MANTIGTTSNVCGHGVGHGICGISATRSITIDKGCEGLEHEAPLCDYHYQAVTKRIAHHRAS